MSVMETERSPIGPQELDPLFGVLPKAEPLRAALAVSGGSDSTALALLFGRWLARAGRPAQDFWVLTVDHGLRPESRAEAEAVAGFAHRLGFRHAILAWNGPKPATGIQEAAREARYRLMAEHMDRARLQVLVTAHTADDQAETLLMRLARGSGVDGLTAMGPLAPMSVSRGREEAPILLARPLLGVTKARLRATLDEARVTWIEDPSNAAPAFERTRLRAAAGTLNELGLTAGNIGLSARRLQRARAALDYAVAEFCMPGAGRYNVHPCGFVTVDATSLRRLPAELALRVLLKGIVAAGGTGEPVPLAKAESLAVAVMAEPAGHWTLARAIVRATAVTVAIEREPGRDPLPELMLGAGETRLWDGRFRVSALEAAGRSFAVRALGQSGLSALRALGVEPPPGVTLNALRAVPAFWEGADLVAVPPLDFFASPGLRGRLVADFVGLER